MSEVRLEKVRKSFGRVVALETLDLAIPEGEFLTLLGPSGCGKTTTLRLIAGFLSPTSGKVLLDGEDVTGLPPQHRSIGMVFQDYALFPHMTIAQNIGFGLKERRADPARIKKRVGELLELIRLADFGGRYPAELSGGQQQRVALARAVAYAPRVLLMDEPLGALDLKLREAMQLEIRRIQRELRTTTVYVTHDQTEAMTMSDRIAVMNQGRVAQLGTAEEIYDAPADRFVAGFVGKINLFPIRFVGREGGWAVAECGAERIRTPPPSPGTATAIAAVRPEHMRIGTQAAAVSDNALVGALTGRAFAGNLVHATVQTAGGIAITVEVRPDQALPALGDNVAVQWPIERTRVLPES